MKPAVPVNRAAVVLLLLAACNDANTASTGTVAPAEPRPAPTVTATMADRPMITTSGSPAPARAVAPGTQFVTLRGGGISMGSLIPRGQTAFHIRNETGAPHELVLRTARGTAARVTVPATGGAVLQAMLGERRYELICSTPGHAERAEFTTYVAGTPLHAPARGR